MKTPKNYGLAADTPVRVPGGFSSGPENEKKYLMRLRCPNGKPVTFSRKGSVNPLIAALSDKDEQAKEAVMAELDQALQQYGLDGIPAWYLSVDLFDVLCTCGENHAVAVYMNMYEAGLDEPIALAGWTLERDEPESNRGTAHPACWLKLNEPGNREPDSAGSGLEKTNAQLVSKLLVGGEDPEGTATKQQAKLKEIRQRLENIAKAIQEGVEEIEAQKGELEQQLAGYVEENASNYDRRSVNPDWKQQFTEYEETSTRFRQMEDNLAKLFPLQDDRLITKTCYSAGRVIQPEDRSLYHVDRMPSFSAPWFSASEVVVALVAAAGLAVLIYGLVKLTTWIFG